MHEQGDIPRRSFLIEHRAAESSQADDPQPRPVLLNQRATETNPSGVQELSSLSSCYDPMAYPLLFPFGDHGWSRLMEQRGRGQIGSKVTIRDLICFSDHGQDKCTVRATKLLSSYVALLSYSTTLLSYSATPLIPSATLLSCYVALPSS